MKQRLIKAASCSIACLILVMQPVASALAETITIGQGAGIVWEGLPFDVTLEGTIEDTFLSPGKGMAAIAGNGSTCNYEYLFRTVSGYKGLHLSSNLILVPRARVTATYQRYDGTTETLTGTIGIEGTKGSTTAGVNVQSPPGYDWCLSPMMSAQKDFFRKPGARRVRVYGTWLIVADGNQTSGKAYPYAYNAISGFQEGLSAPIFPRDVEVRITNIMCSISTPVAVNFGTPLRDTEVGAEMSRQTKNLGVSCSQMGNERINLNINLQVHGISGLYNNEPSRLALDQGGGYITGEVSDGVTGSGNCKATTGLRFDDYLVKLGDIKASESSKSFNRQLTWRLCSGGSSLPTGEVTASAEMLVTFN